jgi:hypothetical protein
MRPQASEREAQHGLFCWTGCVVKETASGVSRAIGAAALPSEHSAQRPDCVAGHVGLELRNVAANYPFEKSHRCAGIEPNSGH